MFGATLSTLSTKPRPLDPVLQSAGRVILGKDREIRQAVACLLAGGHLLIEDLPGVGKTTLAHALARLLGLAFSRIQFTSDLLPADITGVSIYERERGEFRFLPGPVFSQLVLADEINRATPKTQSALLEAMEERQVTVEGETRALPEPFFVIATQNPSHQIGTFPLPESQLDRFLMRIELGYPDRNAERALLTAGGQRALADQLTPMINAQRSAGPATRGAAAVHAAEPLIDYVQALVEATPPRPGFPAWPLAARRPRPAGRGTRLGLAGRTRHGAAGRCSGSAPRGRPPSSARDPGNRHGQGRGHHGADPRGADSLKPWASSPTSSAGCFAGRATGRRRLRLSQRRIFILPTRAGLLFAAALLAMLTGAINYNLALGHALVFLLAGLALTGMVHAFRNLHGLSIAPGRCAPVFAGEVAYFPLHLASDRNSPRLALELRAGDETRSVAAAVAAARPERSRRAGRCRAARLAGPAAHTPRHDLSARPVRRLELSAAGHALPGLPAAAGPRHCRHRRPRRAPEITTATAARRTFRVSASGSLPTRRVTSPGKPAPATPGNARCWSSSSPAARRPNCNSTGH